MRKLVQEFEGIDAQRAKKLTKWVYNQLKNNQSFLWKGEHSAYQNFLRAVLISIKEQHGKSLSSRERSIHSVLMLVMSHKVDALTPSKETFEEEKRALFLESLQKRSEYDRKKMEKFKFIYKAFHDQRRYLKSDYHKLLITFFLSHLYKKFLWIETGRKSIFYFTLHQVLNKFYYDKIVRRVSSYNAIQDRWRMSSIDPRDEKQGILPSVSAGLYPVFNEALDSRTTIFKKIDEFVQKNEKKLIDQWDDATKKLLLNRGSTSEKKAFQQLYKVIATIAEIVSYQSIKNHFIPTIDAVFKYSFNSVYYNSEKLVNLTDGQNFMTLLHWAVYFTEDLSLLKKLLAQEMIAMNINKQDSLCETPLDKAIQLQKDAIKKQQTTKLPKIISLLVQYGGKQSKELNRETGQQKVKLVSLLMGPV